jgi:hypothetical protein
MIRIKALGAHLRVSKAFYMSKITDILNVLHFI